MLDMRDLSVVRAATFVVLVMVAVAAAAETVEWDLSRAGIGGELQQNGSYTAGGVTVTVGQGSATAMPSFMSSYASFKAGNTLQVSTATGNITEVYLVKNSSSAAAVSDVTASVGSITAVDYDGGSAAHWTGAAPSVLFTNGDPSRNLSLTTIVISWSPAAAAALDPPAFSLPEGTYSGPRQLSLTAPANLSIAYRIDDGTETTYTEPITVDRDMTVTAWTINGAARSMTASRAYVINPALPSILMDGAAQGSAAWIDARTAVTVATVDADATIHYEYSAGSRLANPVADPTAASPVLENGSPLPLVTGENQELRVVAVAANGRVSGVARALFSVPDAPFIDTPAALTDLADLALAPPLGDYAGCEVMYTVDGSDPRTSATAVASSVPCHIDTPTLTVRAATRIGGAWSPVRSRTITVTLPTVAFGVPSGTRYEAFDVPMAPTAASLTGYKIYYAVKLATAAADAVPVPPVLRADGTVAGGTPYDAPLPITAKGRWVGLAAIVVKGHVASEPAWVTYNLRQVPPTVFRRIKDASALKAGMPIALVAPDGPATMGDALTAASVTLSEGHLAEYAHIYPDGAFLTLDGEAGAWTLSMGDGEYLVPDSADEYYDHAGPLAIAAEPQTLSIYIAADGASTMLYHYGHAHHIRYDADARRFVTADREELCPVYLYTPVEHSTVGDYKGGETYAGETPGEEQTQKPDVVTFDDDLVAVRADDATVVVKDLGDKAIDAVSRRDGQLTFIAREYDQSNWLVVRFQEAADAALLEGRTIGAGYLTVERLDDGTLKAVVTPETLGEAIYEPNVYTPANFNTAYHDETSEYFVVNPKDGELCNVIWAEWDAEAGAFVMPRPQVVDGVAVNAAGLEGSVAPLWSSNAAGDISATLHDGKLYEFTALVRVEQSYNAPLSGQDKVRPYNMDECSCRGRIHSARMPAGNVSYVVLPLDLEADNTEIVTAIDDVETAATPVATEYYDLSGRRLSRPAGLSVIVERTADGRSRARLLHR